jgi:RimJ/RimL family protein N-acetyltransferase
MPPELHTARLVLRPFSTDDLPWLAYMRDPEWRRYLGRGFPSPEQFIENNTSADWEQELNFAVLRDGVLIGSVHAGLGRPAGVGELACLLAPHAWGQSIAYEACTALLDYAFGTCGLFKAYARVDGRHARSIRVLEKLGLRREAVLRLHRLDEQGERSDEIWYGVLGSEWAERQGTRSSRLEATGSDAPLPRT